jgi:hypothetical protein
MAAGTAALIGLRWRRGDGGRSVNYSLVVSAPSRQAAAVAIER